MTTVQSRFDPKENDLYETPEWVTHALLRHLPWDWDAHILEPACGPGKIVNVLRGLDLRVTAMDKYPYRPDQVTVDFYDVDLSHYDGITHIVTNPPYGHGNKEAVRFMRHALDIHDGWVAMLCTAKFDSGKSRVDLFRDNDRFYGKVVLLDRIQWFPGKYGNTEDHAWYIWGPPGRRDGRWGLLFYEGEQTTDGDIWFTEAALRRANGSS